MNDSKRKHLRAPLGRSKRESDESRKSGDSDPPVFQIVERDDINVMLASCAGAGQKLLVPLADGCFLDIRSSNDNQRHLIMLKRPVIDESEIIACDGFFGFDPRGDITETLWSYRNEINEYYRNKQLNQ